MKRVYYFPACGFGFWYLLGKYQALEKTEEDVYVGASAGSLVCACSLIDHPTFFAVVLECASETLEQYKRVTHGLNLHRMVALFLDQLESHIDTERIHNRLAQIRVQVSEIKGFTIRKRQIQPRSWPHMRQLCMASCYIPWLSNQHNRLTYTVDGMACIDGAFAELYEPTLWQTFAVSSYRGLVRPSREKATHMYWTGVHESNEDESGRVSWIVHPSLLVAALVVATTLVLYLCAT